MQLNIATENIGDNHLFEDVGKGLKDTQDAQKMNRNYFQKNSVRGSNKGIQQT